MPDWRLLVRQRLAGLNIRGADELDIVEELAQHVEDRYRDLCDAGVTDDEAFGRSLEELDGEALTEELLDSLAGKNGGST